jgi:ABC-type transport system involved in multi-copper enzyme maturation permease subunit
MLSALADLFGPIFAKELMEMARRARYYFTRMLYGGVLLFVLFVIFQTEQSLRSFAGVPVRPMSQMAEDFFLAVLWVQYCAVLFFVPLFLSGVIAGEREQKTLELLFTTSLSNREIVFGKLGSRIVAVIVLVLTGVPVIAITMLFGGVNPTVLWQSMLATLVTILFVGALSIYFSATTRTPLGALVRTYWWETLWLIGLPFVAKLIVFAISALTRVFYGEVDVYFALVNPLDSFLAAVFPFETFRLSSVLGGWLSAKLLAGPVLLSLLLLLLTMRAVRRDPGPARWRTWIKGLFIRKKRQLSVQDGRTVIEPARKPWLNPERCLFVFPVRNPLWLRARRARVYDRERHLRRMQTGAWILAVIVIALLAATSPQDLIHEEASMSFHAFAWFGFMLMIGLLAGHSIIGDRRRGFFDLVLVTTMTPREIIGGTSLAVWRHVARGYRLLIALGLFFSIIGASYFSGVLASLTTGTLVICLMVLHGIACSLSAKTIPGALIGTFLFPLIILFGTAMVAGMAWKYHGPVIWISCAVLLPLLWITSALRPNVIIVALFLIIFHISLTALFSCWTYYENRDSDSEYPMSAMHAGYFLISALEHNQYSWRERQERIWPQTIVLYWAAVVINIFWLKWWLARNFDRLCGRKMPRKPRPVLDAFAATPAT